MRLIFIIFLVLIIAFYFLYKNQQKKLLIRKKKLKKEIENKKFAIWKELNKEKNIEIEKEKTMANYLNISLEDFRSCNALYRIVKASSFEESNRAQLALNKKLEKLRISYNAFKRILNE